MRRPKSNGQGRTGVLSTRITPALRDALKSAAMANGRSLSEEVEHRLRRHVARDHYGVCRHAAAVKGMTLLTADETASLFALLVALDEVSGIWPRLEAALLDVGIDDPEAAIEALRAALEAPL
jgi:uncharacterized protein (DUF1778 family)